jgi:hypothetical protein
MQWAIRNDVSIKDAEKTVVEVGAAFARDALNHL